MMNPILAVMRSLKGLMLLSVVMLLPCFYSTTMAADKIQIATSEGYAPYRDADMANGGMTTAILQEAFQRMDAYILDVLSFSTWTEARQRTLENEMMGAFPYLYSETRDQHFEFSEPLANNLVVWFVSAEKPVSGSSAEALKGLKVAKAAGYYRHDIQNYLDEGVLELVETDTLGDAFRQLAAGKVDLVSADMYVGNATIKAAPDMSTSDFRYMDHEYADSALNSLHLLLSEAHPDMTRFRWAFDRTIKEMKEDGTLRKLQKAALESFKQDIMGDEPLVSKQ